MSESIQQPLTGRIPPWAKKVVPVIVSLAILYYYFHNQNWTDIIDACRRANIYLAILAIFIPQIIYWFFEALIVDRHFEWFHGPFDLRKFFWVRGSIYILQFINTALSGGGYLLYLQRKTGITWARLMGIMLFRFGMTMWGICLFMIPATLAMHYYGLVEKIEINIYIWWFFLLVPGLFWMTEAWLFWHHKVNFRISRFVVRDRNSDFWTAFNKASRKRWLLTWAMTLPPFFLMMIGFYFLNLAFDVNVPFLEFMVVGPLAMIIMDLPIAFAGFGTATIAWKALFGDYGSDLDIAALTLFLPFARAACRAMIGLVSLRPALRDIYTLSLTAPKTETAQQPAPAMEQEEA